MLKILLFIPSYCCENQIERVIHKIHLSGIAADLLFVDNRSSDATVQNILSALNKYGISNATVVLNRANYNLGGSHKVAFNYAVEHNYSHLIVLHGDDQADISDILPKLKENEHLKYDCLLGSRFHTASELKGYSHFRIFGNKVLNFFCDLVCKENISDMGSGLNLYSLRFLKDMRYMTFSDDLTFNVSLLFHAYLAGFKVSFFPISWREEDQISNAKVFKQMRLILSRIVKTLKDPISLYDGPTRQYSFEVIYQK